MKTLLLGAIVAAAVGSSGSFVLWGHSHSARPILANTQSIDGLVAVTRTGQDIRRLDKRCHDLSMTIERKRSDLLQAELIPNPGPHIEAIKSRLKNEIEDYLKLLEQKRQLLHDEKSKESRLIDRVPTV